MYLRTHLAVIVACSMTLSLVACQSTSTGGPTANSPAPTSSGAPSSTGSLTRSTPQDSKSFIPASAQGPAKNVPVPKLPVAASKNSKAGAASFVKFYYSLVNYTITTSDATQIKKHTTHSCEVCGNSIIDPADKAKKKGKWYVGGEHHPTVLDSYISGKDLAVVTVEYTADAFKSYVKPNQPLSSSPKLNSTKVSLGLEFNDGWKVYRILGAE